MRGALQVPMNIKNIPPQVQMGKTFFWETISVGTLLKHFLFLRKAGVCVFVPNVFGRYESTIPDQESC